MHQNIFWAKNVRSNVFRMESKRICVRIYIYIIVFDWSKIFACKKRKWTTVENDSICLSIFYYCNWFKKVIRLLKQTSLEKTIFFFYFIDFIHFYSFIILKKWFSLIFVHFHLFKYLYSVIKEKCMLLLLLLFFSIILIKFTWCMQ